MPPLVLLDTDTLQATAYLMNDLSGPEVMTRMPIACNIFQKLF
jgi:hypothetical protein